MAQAHARHAGIPYENREPWLQRLPERLRNLADLILGGRMNARETADTLTVLIDRIEISPDRGQRPSALNGSGLTDRSTGN